MTLEKGKNAGIRPLFWQNRRLGGVLFRHITVLRILQYSKQLYRECTVICRNETLSPLKPLVLFERGYFPFWKVISSRSKISNITQEHLVET